MGGSIGVRASQAELIDLADRFGFESVTARPEEIAAAKPGAFAELLGERGLQWGTAGLPVEFRAGDKRFEEDLERLPVLVEALKSEGVRRVSTWLRPSHPELTYLQNFDRHANRLRRVAQVLAEHDLRLELEYVGTQDLLVRARYPFVHTLAETQEFIARIGTGNVGVALDSWHWWTAGDSVEAIRELTNEEVVLVDLNDAPAGVAREDQLDNRRQLPASTGVIPIKEFLQALSVIDYDGPVRAEPFNQTLNDLDNEAACRATVQSLQKAMALVFGPRA